VYNENHLQESSRCDKLARERAQIHCHCVLHPSRYPERSFPSIPFICSLQSRDINCWRWRNVQVTVLYGWTLLSWGATYPLMFAYERKQFLRRLVTVADRSRGRDDSSPTHDPDAYLAFAPSVTKARYNRSSVLCLCYKELEKHGPRGASAVDGRVHVGIRACLCFESSDDGVCTASEIHRKE
jgi:hypothetical protein